MRPHHYERNICFVTMDAGFMRPDLYVEPHLHWAPARQPLLKLAEADTLKAPKPVAPLLETLCVCFASVKFRPFRSVR